MLKQTLIWTALPHGSDGPLAAGTELRLSLFVAPRLWNDDPTVKKMKLAAFPDFLDWPQAVAQATFEVEFEGGPTVAATPDFTVLRSDLWQALFHAGTDVLPFAFEDFSGVPVLTFPAGAIHDVIRGVYQRAATDPAYGAGGDLPGRGQLAADPDLVDIARPVRPEPPFEPVNPDRGPVRIDDPDSGPGPDPGPGPDGKPPEKPGCGGCGCFGCLAWPVSLVRALLKRLGGASTTLGFGAGFGGFGSFGGGGAAESGNPEKVFEGPAAEAGALEAISPQKEAFDQLKTYLEPHSKLTAPLPTEEDLSATYDFHKMVSALGDYPRLLRLLGLVVDVVVTLPAALPAATGKVRVTPTLPLATATSHFSPRTHYLLGAESFLTRPRPVQPESNNGLLRLDDAGRFRVLQLDVAGGGIKLQNTATNLVGLEALNEWPANSPEEAGLPALQTAGLSVVRVENAVELAGAFRRSYALNASLAAVDLSPLAPLAAGGAAPPATDELFAEDVARGYRIDVFDDKSAAWHSLCQRIGTYRFLEAPGAPLTLDDEGFVQIGATEPLPGTATRVLRVHESLFTWDGWSLCAPRPGQTILPDHSSGKPANTAVTPFKLETAFRATPGSLPRLRFGYSYRLRARLVDLAGNSVFDPVDPAFAATPAEVTPEIRFQRFEPVSPPPVVLRAVPVEGESLEEIVVRSTIDETAATIAGRSSERHLVPPKTSQLMAERHRKFDASPGMGTNAAVYDLASREAGSLTHRLNTATGNLELIAGVQEVKNPERTYWLQTKDQLELAYLPDPYARGVLLQGLPGLAAGTIVEPNGVRVNKLPFDGLWPDLQPLRLRLVGLEAGAAPAQPAWDAANRVLTVQLAQGESAKVRISSYFHSDDLENMAIWGWTAESAPPALVALRGEAVAGRNWLHLPYRTLVLVHAVQQPLEIPKITALVPTKQLGGTSATLNGQVGVDAKSTGKIEVRAAWQDPFDDPAKPAYNSATDVVNQEMQVGEILVIDPKNDLVGVTALEHALRDTKYHRVTYTPIATTRFREYFPPAVLANPQDLIRPRAADVGTPDALAARSVLDIPNSARPDAPRPQYILPTWEWSESLAGPVTTHVRPGGGLRVYLERPWFSSGAGELLGVLVRADAGPVTGEIGDTIRKYTSEWGMDPLRNAAPTGLLKLTDFLAPQETGLSLSLEELPGIPVHVAGYAPEYDAERNLWYCDLALQTAAYFPFVRLALARFQPISVTGAHLSRVVLADFAQVVPDRRVDYDLSQLGVDATVPVRVSGPAYVQSGQEQLATTLMVARLERRQFEHLDDELGWEPVSTAVLTPTALAVQNTVWEATVSVPSPAPGPLRLAILEVEVHPADPGGLRDILGLLQREPVDTAAGAAGTLFRRLPLGYRIVFADALLLP